MASNFLASVEGIRAYLDGTDPDPLLATDADSPPAAVAFVS